MESIKFRLAQIDDLENIKTMYNSIVQNMYKQNINIWNEYYPVECFEDDINNKQLYVLEKNSEIVACGALVFENSQINSIKWQNNSASSIFLTRLGVDPKYSKIGIGSIMLKNLIYETIRKNIQYLRLFVVDTNIPAINFYKKNGFKQADGIYIERINKDLFLKEYGFEFECKKIDIYNIKTPQDIFDYMQENISYGWCDKENNMHLDSMKGFRQHYRTLSIEQILEKHIGCCIEQVYLMHYLFDKINIKNKMFCCRIFEPDDYDNYEEEEHMHCFILYYKNGKVYHMEHPNKNLKGIYEYNTEQEAINTIVNYYIELRGGKDSPTKEFFEVKPGLSFQEFNKYINNL